MKKILATLMLLFVLAIISVFGLLIYSKYVENEEVRNRIAVLPEIDVPLISSSNAAPQSVQPTILNYFNTMCRYCQAEIQSIIEHKRLSDESRIILISDEPRKVIEVFAQNVGIDSAKIEVHWDSAGSVKKLFRIERVPATYIYGRDSVLIQQFKGETKADVLYSFIK